MDKILKVKDIQDHLGISKTGVYKLITTPGFPKIQIGHRYYIPESAYSEWIREHTDSKILI